MGIKAEKALRYWVLGRQWRVGDSRFGAITMEAALQEAANLGGELNSLGWLRCENVVAALLDQMINNRRNRKRKPTNNVVDLNKHRAYQPRVLLDMVRAEGAEALVGREITLQIKVG